MLHIELPYPFELVRKTVICLHFSIDHITQLNMLVRWALWTGLHVARFQLTGADWRFVALG